MAEFFTYFGAGSAAMIGIGQLLRGLSRRNTILALFFCASGVQLTSAMLFDGSMAAYPGLLIAHIIFAASAGPFLFLFFTSLLEEELRFTKILGLQFAFPSLSFCFVIFATILDPTNLSRWVIEFQLPEMGLLRFFSILAGLLTVGNLLYLLGRAIIIWDPERGKGGRLLIVSGFVLLAFVAAAGITLGIALKYFFAIKVALALLVLAFYLAAQHYPFLLNQGTEADQKRFARSLLHGLDLDELSARLHQLIAVEKLFCDEDLTLPRLAQALNIASHQLSQYLNQHLGKNFTTYINEFRVNEARNLLLEQPDRTTLSIGLAVGFNSNSAFHEAFVRFTGIPPGRFRKK
ncbi:MAG: AraC family transcriptional regulator [Leptospirales bacterium]|nr:AraC family transcriptional regulator [Leptospirales bacterium]